MESYYYHISKTKTSLADMSFSPSFDKDSDDKVVTEQLIAVVDVTFVPHIQ